ncbi:hypothetical protein [Nitrosococcus watsonii]|uniref:hypothetical protein n=1 Tax=Nitrosococcus watsonii TaxID=473531 RepID=UPI0002F380B2|nr:hypothetical protein [Nitrosococcus watsonii]
MIHKLPLTSFPHPEVMIGNAAERFDAEGNLTDEKTRESIRELLQELGLGQPEFKRLKPKRNPSTSKRFKSL